MWVTKQLLVPIDFLSMKNTLKVSGDQSDGLPTFLKIYVVCVCFAERVYGTTSKS